MSFLIKILLVTTLLVPQKLIAQTYLIQEDFNNCAVPNNWVNETLGSGWNIGVAGALQSASFSIPDNGSCIAVVNDGTLGNDASNDRLIMPKLDITGVYNLTFRYDVFIPTGSSFFYIEYSHDSVSWHTGYSVAGTLPTGNWTTIEFPANGGFFQGGNDLWIRLRYKDFGFESTGIAIDNFMVYEPAPNDLKLSVLASNEWSEFGQQNLKGRIYNNGNSVINNYTVNWQLDNGVVGSQSFTSFTYGTTLSPAVVSDFEVINAYLLNAIGSHTLKVWTSFPNGIVDSNSDNDTLVMVVNTATVLPEKRVLLEKFTHTQCGPCYSGDINFDQMLTDHPFVAGASIHSAPSDPFSIPDGDDLDATYIYGHPEFVADRKILFGNVDYGISQYQGVTTNLDLAAEDKQAVSVSITNYDYNTLTHTVQFDVVADFYGDYASALGINAYILEDSVWGYQTNAPDPNNYYHNHVVRAMLGGAWGSPFQMSDVIGGTYSKTFQYTIPQDQNPENISIIGFVQKINSNIESRHILNCTPSVHLDDAVSLILIENDKISSIKIFPNPSTGIIYFKVSNEIGESVTVSISDMTGKTLDTYQFNTLNTVQTVNLSHLPPGVYVFSAAKDSGAEIDRKIVCIQ